MAKVGEGVKFDTGFPNLKVEAKVETCSTYSSVVNTSFAVNWMTTSLITYLYLISVSQVMGVQLTAFSLTCLKK